MTETEAAAERMDVLTVYQITWKLRGERTEPRPQCKMDGRSTITEEQEKIERLREHFQQLLNRCDPPTIADIIEAEQELDIELGPIIVQEAKDAITKLKNGETPRDDNVYADMLNAEEVEMP